MIEKRRLGTTGLAVSRIALGCGNFGGVGSPRHLIGHGLDRDAAFASMDEAVALGIDLFDTAHSYAGGASEVMIGEWLAAQPLHVRDGIHLATKVGTVATEIGVTVDLSPRNIVEQLSASLARLGVPRIDLCLAHAPDPGTPIEATLEGFADAIERGLVTHVGVCNVDREQLAAATLASVRLGLPRYECVQNEYNLLARGDEQGLLQFTAEAGIGYIAYSPVAGGLLSGRYGRGEAPPPDSRLALRPPKRALSPEFFDRVGRLQRSAALRGCSPGALALAWVIANPSITAAICGPRRQAKHLALAEEAASVELTESERVEIGRWFDLDGP